MWGHFWRWEKEGHACSGEAGRGCLLRYQAQLPMAPDSFSTCGSTGFRTERSLEIKSRLYQTWDQRQNLSIARSQFM